MALKTNTKAVTNKIKSILTGHYNNYIALDNDLPETESFDTVKTYIQGAFYSEKLQHDNRYNAGKISKQDLFEEWVSGLCSALPSEYYYSVSAVDMLGDILEETEAEKARFTEAQAEHMITYLFYKVLF